METLVAVSHHHRNHHNQYYGKNRGNGSGRFEFGSVPSGGFRGINCRTFQSGAGLLPTPLKSYSQTTTPLSKKERSPKTPSFSGSENHKAAKRAAKSGAMPIPIKMNLEMKDREFGFSERWAGPAYSNSPPPSSLPIPKFQLKPKRTVSLELPSAVSEIDLQPMAKSAPASPTRERSPSPGDMMFDSADSATKTLRRILNLDN